MSVHRRPLAGAWDDVPLFGAELLLGPGSLSSELRSRIQDFLREVARSRKAPLHAATAWNALYFGYDLKDGTYRGVADSAGFTDVRRDPCPPLPVGAFVRYERGHHLLWGEVVAVFGNAAEAFADPMGSVDAEWPVPHPGDVHAGLLPQAAFDELAIVDWGSIVGLDDSSTSELMRARRNAARGHASGIDVSGHVSGPRTHTRIPDVLPGTPSGPVPADGLAAYAQHLMLHHRPLVDAGFIADILRDPGDSAVLHEALLTSMITVAELLGETPGLLSWSGYAVPEERHAARCASPELLGGADLRELARIATRACDRPRRLAVMPALGGLVDSSRDATDDRIELVFAEAGLAETVVQTNLFLAAHAALAENLERFGLVNGWQAGGIWETRPVGAAAFPDAAEPHDTEDAEDADDAATERQEPRPEPGTVDSEIEELLAELMTAADSMNVHMVTLSEADVAGGTLTLSGPLRIDLGERRRFSVDLYQAGTALLPPEATQAATAESGALRLAWPLTVAAGAHAIVGVPATGTRLRVDVVDQLPAQPSPAAGRADAAPGPHTVLQALIVDCVRRLGTPGPEGSRALPGDRLRHEVSAAWEDAGATVPFAPLDFVSACRMLVSDRRLQVTEGSADTHPDAAVVHRGPDTYTWWPHGTWQAAVADPEPVGGFADAVKGLHWVPGFVRALPPGSRASRRAREDYAAWARAHGQPEQLGPGITFVRGHHRGQEDALGQAMESDRETR